VAVGRCNIPHHQLIGHPNKKINTEILELSDTIDQMDLADVYRIFHPTSAQFTFFSAAHGTYSEINHILGQKASLSKYKKIDIIPCILSDHNALKVEHSNKNNRKKTCKQLEVEQHISQ
jgi:exonuclease III